MSEQIPEQTPEHPTGRPESTQVLPAAPNPSYAASGRHPVSIGHLVMGVAFLGLLAVWALVASDTVEGADIRFLLPAPWVLAGIAGLLALITSDRRRHARNRTGWVTPPE